ncbi:ninjurin-1-like [Sitodiplosis mosellana]|uniref:ninjurin-1-like n=1 Tax=Sitodiplosis mosellana TaxID=263140 RepID=UPI002443D997|nr:ninjurin-1-like [Sitodiplosis mosellana]
MFTETSNKNVTDVQESVTEEHRKPDQADFILPILLNPNTYASKKTLAHGMLDLALLSANGAQLKLLLSNGKQQEFYMFLLWLIATSIVLQVVQAVVCVVLGLIFDINHVDDQKKAEIINNVSLAISIVVVAINVLISVFDVIST